MHHGDNVVNEVIGVYDSLAKAQHALIDNVIVDLQYSSYHNFWSDCNILEERNINLVDWANNVFANHNLCLNIKFVRMWNGDDEQYCEDYQNYHIEERQVI